MFHWFKKHTKEGLEIPDNTPIEVALPRPLTLAEQIKRFTASEELKNLLRQRQMDTFDEADDLEVDDESPDGVRSPYEDNFEGDEMSNKAHVRLDEIRHGMVEEMPIERQNKAKSWPKKQEEKAPAPAQ